MKKYTRILSAVIAALIALSFCSCGSGKDNEVPAGMKRLDMEIDDYDLFVPQSWTQDLSTGVVSAYLSDNSSVSMMTVQLDNETPGLDEFWEKNEKDFKDTFGDSFKYEGEHPQKTLLDGVEARKYVYTATVTGKEYKFMQVICLRSSSALVQTLSYVYVFTYTAEPDRFDEHLDDVESMLSNFKFKN